MKKSHHSTAIAVPALFAAAALLWGCIAAAYGQGPPATVVAGKKNVFLQCNYHDHWLQEDSSLPLPGQAAAYAEGNAAGVSLDAPPGTGGAGFAEIGVALTFDMGGYTLEEIKDWPVCITADLSYEISAEWSAKQGRASAAIGMPDFFESNYDAIGYPDDNGTRQKSALIEITAWPEGQPVTMKDLYTLGRIRIMLYAQAVSVTRNTGAFASIAVNSITVDFPGQSPSGELTAAFAAAPQQGAAPLSVQFADLSSGAVTEWLWDFGDSQESREQNPLHIYTEPGTYSVSLTVSDARGNSADKVKQDYITASVPVLAPAFRAYPRSGEAPLFVKFFSFPAETASAWLWDFGDGQTSAEQNPLHIYESPGTYSVYLTVTDYTGQTSAVSEPDYIVVTEPPVAADFSAEPREGIPPLSVQFTDLSSGAVAEWLWDFGDGQTGAEQNPLHIYESVGVYDVTLSVHSAQGEDTKTMVQYIAVLDNPPDAGFAVSPASGKAPLRVRFTDTSSGNITRRLWHFGDGEYSEEESPEHVYAVPGSYTVALRVLGATGIVDTEVQENALTVLPGVSDLFSLSGTLQDLEGREAHVFLSGGEQRRAAVTDEGEYVFEGLARGEYRVTPYGESLAFSPPSSPASIVNRSLTGIDFSADTEGLSFASVYSEPQTVRADGSTPVLLLAQVTHPLGGEAIAGVACNLLSIGGESKQLLFDDGTNGDETAGDGVYAFQTVVADSVSPGEKGLPLRVADTQGGLAFASLGIMVTRAVTATLQSNASEKKTIANDIEGQTLTISCRAASENTASLFRRRSGAARTSSGLLLQIFDPDNNQVFTNPVPISAETTEKQLENAAQGTWSYEIQNAGAQSQQYSLSVTTAGTGILHGMVADAETGEGVDGVTVVTSGGASTVTAEGYYVLMHPSGVFSVQASAPQYAASSRSVTISTGSDCEADMILNPSASDNSSGGSCLFSQSVFTAPAEEAHLKLLRSFRDGVLAASNPGRQCIGLYYRYSREVSRILAGSPELAARVKTCAREALPAVASVMQGRPWPRDPRLTGNIQACLQGIRQRAGGELRREIDRLDKKCATSAFYE